MRDTSWRGASERSTAIVILPLLPSSTQTIWPPRSASRVTLFTSLRHEGKASTSVMRDHT